ncbi:MAG TPA: nitroreductase [Asticcacaulis sp.]|nr:nitroreductase [Asticcacaulis sp.]
MTAFDTTPHEFGKPLPQKASDAVLEALFNRRSAPAPTLGMPGPSPEQMDLLIRLGLRVPDHGKIGPWRIVRFTPEAKTQVVEKLKALAGSRGEKKDVGALIKMSTPPEMLMVVSAPIQPHKIPLWEQQLSAAAVCQNLLIAAGAMGYGANWITDWYAYDAEARAILGVKEDENVAGFIYLGTPSEPPLERERPDYDARVSWWAE